MPGPTIDMNPPDAPIVGALSTDDELWVAECDITQVRALIHDPMKWMSDLSDRADRLLELKSPFAMKVRLAPTVVPGVEKPYVVEGISGTSVLTIRPVRPQGAPVQAFWSRRWTRWAAGLQSAAWAGWDEGWSAHWQSWADPALELHVATARGVGFAHMEITTEEDRDRPEVRADKIASFLVQGVTSGGELFNRVLAKPPTQPDPSRLGGLRAMDPNDPEASVFAKISRASLRNTSFLYAGVGGPACDRACDNMVGYVNEDTGLIEIDEMTIKCY